MSNYQLVRFVIHSMGRALDILYRITCYIVYVYIWLIIICNRSVGIIQLVMCNSIYHGYLVLKYISLHFKSFQFTLQTYTCAHLLGSPGTRVTEALFFKFSAREIFDHIKLHVQFSHILNHNVVTFHRQRQLLHSIKWNWNVFHEMKTMRHQFLKKTTTVFPLPSSPNCYLIPVCLVNSHSWRLKTHLITC